MPHIFRILTHVVSLVADLLFRPWCNFVGYTSALCVEPVVCIVAVTVLPSLVAEMKIMCAQHAEL